jgi:glycosyltransferase involved in cell wall biosynthesis
VRCLYIVPNSPISPNFKGGGSAIYYEQLHSLIELGVEVYLWHFCYESRLEEFERFISSDHETWAEVNAVCSKIYRTQISDMPTLSERIYNKSSNFLTGNAIRNPLVRGSCSTQFRDILSKVEPDLIWAQHLISAQVSMLQKRVPVVYSHHDWLYKIKNPCREQTFDLRSKKFEESAALSAAAVVSGSNVECTQLSKVGCTNVHYIPVAYESAQIPISRNGDKPRIVHLGGMGTTATRIGLERFFDVVWKKLDIEPSNLWVVGDVTAASDQLKKDLEKVTCTGYVKKLGDVLRPSDIHVIPWEYETGQRTRLVQAFNYGQAVVAMRKSVSCFPEVVNNFNCILVDSLEEMSKAVSRLMLDVSSRTTLGENARATFLSCFTRGALLPKYKSLIGSLNIRGLSFEPEMQTGFSRQDLGV